MPRPHTLPLLALIACAPPPEVTAPDPAPTGAIATLGEGGEQTHGFLLHDGRSRRRSRRHRRAGLVRASEAGRTLAPALRFAPDDPIALQLAEQQRAAIAAELNRSHRRR